MEFSNWFLIFWGFLVQELRAPNHRRGGKFRFYNLFSKYGSQNPFGIFYTVSVSSKYHEYSYGAMWDIFTEAKCDILNSSISKNV